MYARARQLLALAASLGVVAAIWIQDHTDALPQGLFNNGREWFTLASDICGVAAIALVLLFAYEIASAKSLWLGRVARGGIVFVVVLELCLLAIDCVWISGDPDARIGGPYQEARTAGGEPVFFRKRQPASRFGFRTPVEVPHEARRPRLLFLGDSYTEGSGRDLACNYPEVVAHSLSERLGHPVEVMNAGVSGYGPVDARNLLRLLREDGYEFDAVVYSLLLENDFTDNLVGTERRVVAGLNLRFPRSRLLRVFHPLNWRSFRFPLLLARIGGAVRRSPDVVHLDAGRCRLEGEPLDEIDAPLRDLVLRRLKANYHREEAYARSSLAETAIGEIRAEAAEAHAGFVLVVFPDRLLVDPVLRAGIGIADRSADYDLGRWDRLLAGWQASPNTIDMRSVLDGRTELYRARDTHLNDLGNLVAGQFVAERLAALLREGLRGGSAPEADPGR